LVFEAGSTSLIKAVEINKSQTAVPIMDRAWEIDVITREIRLVLLKLSKRRLKLFLPCFSNYKNAPEEKRPLK
jgi:hypothetical protein